MPKSPLNYFKCIKPDNKRSSSEKNVLNLSELNKIEKVNQL